MALLQENARLPTSELARRLQVSRTTVQNRLVRLQDQGVIAGFTTKLGSEYEDTLITALASLVVAPKTNDSLIAWLRSRPEVRRISAVSGPYDLFVEISAASVHEIDRILDDIGALDGVERTTSMIVLSVKYER